MDDTFDIEIEDQEESLSQAIQLPSNFLTIGEIEPDDVKVYIKQDVYKDLEKYALEDTTHERGTIILGDYYQNLGKMHVVISNYIEARYTDASASTLTFTHETWDYVHKEHDAKYPDKKIVGWQHTHPSYGIFLSNYDLFIHENFFNLPFQVAYVIDPIQRIRGFFQWKNDRIEKLKGFYIYDDVGKPIKIVQKQKKEANIEQPKQKGTRLSIVLLVLVILIAAGSVLSWFSLKNTIKKQEEEIKNLQSSITNGSADNPQDQTLSTNELLKMLNNQKSTIDEQQKTIGDLQSAVDSLTKEKSQEDYIFYTVKSGDTLNGICSDLGIDYNKNRINILEINHISNENIISVGQEIKFPSSMKKE